jgi:hypothetical protein
VLTQPLFFLVLLGLVKTLLWDPLVRALRVPVRLPLFVWISSGCGSAVVRRSSRSLRGFGASLPVAWSHPTLAGIKLPRIVVLWSFGDRVEASSVPLSPSLGRIQPWSGIKPLSADFQQVMLLQNLLP